MKRARRKKKNKKANKRRSPPAPQYNQAWRGRERTNETNDCAYDENYNWNQEDARVKECTTSLCRMFIKGKFVLWRALPRELSAERETERGGVAHQWLKMRPTRAECYGNNEYDWIWLYRYYAAQCVINDIRFENTMTCYFFSYERNNVRTCRWMGRVHIKRIFRCSFFVAAHFCYIIIIISNVIIIIIIQHNSFLMRRIRPSGVPFHFFCSSFSFHLFHSLLLPTERMRIAYTTKEPSRSMVAAYASFGKALMRARSTHTDTAFTNYLMTLKMGNYQKSLYYMK